MNWLDTETKEILGRENEPKLAPPKAAEFGLVLIRKGSERQRLVRAIRSINHCDEPSAMQLARQPVPVTINAGLSEEEALWGQFELICCDAAGIFIRSEILRKNGPDYLHALFLSILQSPEFQDARINVFDVPATESGREFVDQFLGPPPPGAKRRVSRFSVVVPFKKARIMSHWAARVGAQVPCEAPNEADF